MKTKMPKQGIAFGNNYLAAFIALLLSFTTLGSIAQNYNDVPLYGANYKRLTAGVFTGPTGCGAPSLLTGKDSALKRFGQYYDTCNKRFYLYDPKLHAWDTVHIGVSTGGGSTNTSLGSGFRVAVNGTNNLKSLSNTYGNVLDSTTSGQIGFKVDTTKIQKKIVWDLPFDFRVGASGANDTAVFPAASAVQDGYLTSTKYAQFDAKWGPSGNAVSSGNFLGTTNSQPLILKTNNNEIGNFSADGNYKVRLGYLGSGAGATGNYSMATNYETHATGNYSFAAGFQCIASGLASTALSRNATASGSYSFSAGSYSIASGNSSAALNNAEVKTYGGAGFGIYNETSTDISSSSTQETYNRIFVIGNGENTGNRSNALTVLNGTVGAGQSLFGFNVLAPTAYIELKAGTSGVAPIRFNSGNPTTTPAAGQLQYKTGMLILDSSSSVRDTLASYRWVRANAGGGSSSLAIGSSVTSATAKGIFYAGTGGTLQQSPTKFVYDSTNVTVGIGTNSPAGILNVVGGTGDFRFSKGASDVTPTISVINTSGMAGGILAGTSGAAFCYDNSGKFYIISENTSAFTSNALGGGAVRMTVTGTGEVGINTTSPGEKLEVDGNAKVSGKFIGRNIIYRTLNASDADFTAAVGTAYILPDNTADRTITLPTPQDADIIRFQVTGSTFHWDLSASVTLPDNSTTVSRLDTYVGKWVTLYYDGANSKWKILEQ